MPVCFNVSILGVDIKPKKIETQIQCAGDTMQTAAQGPCERDDVGVVLLEPTTKMSMRHCARSAKIAVGLLHKP
jgi:hypothetical protein